MGLLEVDDEDQREEVLDPQGVQVADVEVDEAEGTNFVLFISGIFLILVSAVVLCSQIQRCIPMSN